MIPLFLELKKKFKHPHPHFFSSNFADADVKFYADAPQMRMRIFDGSLNISDEIFDIDEHNYKLCFSQ